MIERLIRFWRQPASRRRQRLGFTWTALVTHYWYGPRLRALGRRSIIGKPLFWTPEYMEVGDGVLIWPGCRFEGISLGNAFNDQDPQVVIGDGVVMQQSCHITAAGRLVIGAGTLISFNVSIQDTDHRYDDLTISVSHQPLTFAQTTIGENCFLGAGARVLAGTRLGKHCVVGANAVVRGEFPEFSVIAGNPGRVVKRYDATECRWTKVGSSTA